MSPRNVTSAPGDQRSDASGRVSYQERPKHTRGFISVPCALALYSTPINSGDCPDVFLTSPHISLLPIREHDHACLCGPSPSGGLAPAASSEAALIGGCHGTEGHTGTSGPTIPALPLQEDPGSGVQGGGLVLASLQTTLLGAFLPILTPAPGWGSEALLWSPGAPVHPLSHRRFGAF